MKNTFKLLGLTLLSLAVLAAVAVTNIKPVYAQLDVPYIVYWEDGIPYTADDIPVEIWAGEQVWCIDETETDASKAFVLLDENYNVIEATEIPYEEDSSDTSDLGYDASEDEETGTLNISASVPEEMADHDVFISIISDDNTIQYRLYAENNWEKTVSIPVGTYKVLTCYIVGDDTLVYQPSYNDEIEVVSTGARALTITFYSGVALNELDTSSELETETIVAEETNSPLWIYGVLFVVVVFVFFVLYLVFRIFRTNHRTKNL